MSNDITEQLTDYILKEVAGSPPAGGARPGPDFPIIEKGLVDSLGLFKIIAFLEDRFQVSVAPEEILFENFATIGAITQLVNSKRGKSS